jgi:hypothetical protein
MTTHGIMVLGLMGLVLLLWVLSLVRRGRLYVGYGALFLVAIIATIVALAFPPILSAASWLIGTNLPASTLTLLALAFVIAVLVYIFTQITVISNRLAAVVQELAIQGALEARSDPAESTGRKSADT